MPSELVEHLEGRAADADNQEKPAKSVEQFKRAVTMFRERFEKLPNAKKRIEELEKDWLKIFSVFVVDVIVTNSGGQGISLTGPVWLHVREPKEADGRVEMLFRDDEHAVMIQPKESKRIVLVSRRNNQAKQDTARGDLEDRFVASGQGEAWVSFTDSTGKVQESTKIRFIPRPKQFGRSPRLLRASSNSIPNDVLKPGLP